MSVYRWVGVIGHVNKPTRDRRTLALGDDRLIAHIRHGTSVWPTEPDRQRLQHRPLPLPLSSALDDDLPDVVGEIDMLWLDPVATGIRAAGTIDITPGANWGDTLLRGESIPAGVSVECDRVSRFAIRWWHLAGLRALLSRRGYLIGEHIIMEEWRITGAALQSHAAWLTASIELAPDET